MRRKKLLIALTSLLAILVLAVVLAPTLLSGYARGRIEREIAARVLGTVSVRAVELGWFSPQRLSGLAIDGGAEVGKIDLTLEVAEGLLALVRGSDISLTLAGAADTAVDGEGRVGLARLARPAQADAVAGDPKAPQSGQPQSTTPLGPRRLTVTLDGLDLSARAPDGGTYALRDLSGDIALTGTDLRMNLTAGTVDPSAAAAGRQGELSIDADLALRFTEAGGADPAATAGKALISASRIAIPTAAGEIACSTLLVDLAKSAAGDIAVKADIAARVAGSSEATVRADVAIAAPFDAAGAFVLDPAAVSATIEARGVPMAALQPFAPEIAEGTRLSLVDDIGETADLTIVKQRGNRARIALAARQVQFALDGAVAPDGSSIEGGTVTAAASLRPELLRGLGLVDPTALKVALRGERLSWRKDSDVVRALGGSLVLNITDPFECAVAADPMRLRAESLEMAIEKEPGKPTARAVFGAKARYGAAGDTSVSASGELDLASRALTQGALDATLRLDPEVLERLTGGACSARGKDASLQVSVPEIAYLPSEEYQGLRALVARARVQMSGAVAVEGAGTTAAVNDLAVDLSTPRGGKPGTLAFGARVDGAQVRVEQEYGPLAPSVDLANLGLRGTVSVDGLDPAVIARLAPGAARSVGLLGRGGMRLDMRNRTERGVILADFNLDAAAVDASGAFQYESSAIRASNIVVDATLTAEGLASLDLGPETEFEPGARVSLRAPAIAFARAGADGAWAPSGDVTARLVVEQFRVRRAPGIVAPIGIAQLDASATYVLAEERAAVSGRAALGGGGTAGELEFALAWRKPVEAKLFAGVEGTFALNRFDLARFEPSFGLEEGAYSGVLGGPGSLRVEVTERGVPGATVAIDFPRTRGNLGLTVPLEGDRRIARVAGTLSSEIAPDTFAKLAGIARDPARKVIAPVSVSVEISAASLPLDAAMKPEFAAASIALRGALSPVVLELPDPAGKRLTLSTGALALSLDSAALADELSLRITGKGGQAEGAAAGDPPAVNPEGGPLQVGSLDVNARVRGAVARIPAESAAPTIDGTLRATRFPSATIDAFAATGGSVGRALGDSVDAQLEARDLSSTAGSFSAKVSSPYATLDAPALTLGDGALRVASDRPVQATFTMSPGVREQLLASINPVFSDVSTGAPARFSLTDLSWPLDGDKSKFDAAFRLETGEVKLVNSGIVTGLLALASAGRVEGFDAFLEPLQATVDNGRLVYRDFTLRVGKTAAGAWRNSLVFAGDIDLAAKPIRANSITTSIPLADAANWSTDARNIVRTLEAASPELIKALAVGIEMSGPLFDAAGKPVKPRIRPTMPDVGAALKDDPGAILDAAGGIIDIFRKKKEAPPPK